MQRTGNPRAQMGIQIGIATEENNMELLQKKMELPLGKYKAKPQ